MSVYRRTLFHIPVIDELLSVNMTESKTTESYSHTSMAVVGLRVPRVLFKQDCRDLKWVYIT